MDAVSGPLSFDVVIVGAGCIGSAASRHLAAARSTNNGNGGASICLVGPAECHLDDFSGIHAQVDPKRSIFAEHYDEGRITRCTSPDPVWSETAKASLDRYHKVQEDSGVVFYHEVGCLSVGPQGNEELERCSNIPGNHIARLSEQELKTRFPFFNFQGLKEDGKELVALHEVKRAGYISPKLQIKAHQLLATNEGATKIFNDVITNIVEEAERVTLFTEEGATLQSPYILLTTGGYTDFDGLLPDDKKLDMILTTHTTLLAQVTEEDAVRLCDMPSIVFYGQGPHEYFLPPILYPNGKYYVKIGHDETIGRELKEKSQVTEWYRGGGDQDIGIMLKITLQLLPGLEFQGFRTRACVISKTSTGCPYIGWVSRRIAVAVGGNGTAAKSADEWGRLGAQVLLSRLYFPLRGSKHETADTHDEELTNFTPKFCLKQKRPSERGQ